MKKRDEKNKSTKRERGNWENALEKTESESAKSTSTKCAKGAKLQRQIDALTLAKYRVLCTKNTW